ncbi:MAG: hypothetical protein ACYDBJ_07160 [Aggregatilineales bacterium]
MRQWLRAHRYILVGAALLVLAADGFIIPFRIIGLSREIAIYAGLLTFTLFTTFVARRWFKTRRSSGENHNG